MDIEGLKKRLRDEQATFLRHSPVCMEAADALDQLQRELEEARKDAGWINVKDSTPANGQFVLIAILTEYVNAPARYDIGTARYDSGWGAYRQPTHWMPFPSAPDAAREKQG